MMMPVKPLSRRLKFAFLVGYFLLTAMFTYPVLFDMSEGFAGVAGYGDSFDFVWIIWWIKHALVDLCTNPYVTPLLYHPQGLNLSFQTLTFANTLPAVLLQFFFSPMQCYNICFLATFILAGFGVALLVYELTQHHIAAFIAGAIYAFSPYHVAHSMAHLNLSTIQWIPFFILYLHRMLQSGGFKNAIWMALFFTATTLSCWYYGFYMMFWGVFHVGMYRFYLKKTFAQGFWRFGTTSGVLALILLFPFVFPLLSEMASGSSYMVRSGFDTFVADVLGYVTPGVFHPLFGQWVAPLAQKFRGNPHEFTVYLGWIPLGMSLFVLRKGERNIRFWGIAAVTFALLSFGPKLYVAGQDTGIPLPFQILTQLPGFNIARCASRFAVLVILSISVLSGLGFARLIPETPLSVLRTWRKGSHSTKLGLSCILLMGILLEYLPPSGQKPYLDFPMIRYSGSPIYQTFAQEKDANFAILELPFDAQLYNSIYLFHQTIHQKPILNGFTGRVSREASRFLRSSALLHFLIDPGLTPPTFDRASEETNLLDHRIRFIVVTRPWLLDSLRRRYPLEEALAIHDQVLNILDRLFFKTYELGAVSVYEVKEAR